MSADTVHTPITVALVEDHADTRERLLRVLSLDPHLQVVFSADNATDTMAWLDQHHTDVLLVDLGLPDRHGLDVVRHCHRLHPDTDIMVVTLFGDESLVLAAIEAGAFGYLLKDGTEAELARHVSTLRAGGSPMTPLIARQLLGRLVPTAKPSVTNPATPTYDALSSRELDILQRLSRGYTYAETARLLDIAPSTVQSHVKHIYSKLAVHSRTEAVFEARQLGLL